MSSRLGSDSIKSPPGPSGTTPPGYDIDPPSEYKIKEEKDKRGQANKPKRTSLACIRCRARHIRCPGGDPCKKCLLAKSKCEYVEADRKIVVSMKYLSKLHDDIARLKKDNAMLRNDLKVEADKRLSLESRPSFPSRYAASDPMPVDGPPAAAHGPEDDDVDTGPNSEVIHPSLDRHGRLIQSRTGEKVYVGSSSMTLFGLEIQNMVPSFSSASILLNSSANSPISPTNSQSYLGGSPKSQTTDTSNITTSSVSGAIKRETEILEKEGNAYKITLAKTNTRPGLSINFTLPSYSYAMLLVDTFINYNDGCFYFFNEGLVKRFLMNLYSGKASENIRILKRNVSLNKGPASDENTIKKDADGDTILETIWFCKILLIFAIGEMYLGTESDTHIKRLKFLEKANRESKRKNFKDKPSSKNHLHARRNTLPGSGFFYQASELFTGLFASGAIDNITKDGGIEVMLLYAFYLQVADCTIASYFYFGLALRSTLILGWHVDADKDNLDRFELEHRRRIWWTVYMYERMLSSKAGLPLSFADDSVSTELPFDFNNNLDDFPRDETDVRGFYIFPSAEYINNCVTITQINALILSSLYTKQPSANILPVVSDLVHKLINWKTMLPEFLRVDFSVENLHVSRLVVNLMTEYFQGMNLAVRPLLFHFSTKKLKELQMLHTTNKYVDLTKYSKNVLTLLNSSFQASINTIKLIWALLPENMVALFGWMDREYLFTSASTLILFNASFGVHDATKEHLDHALTIFTKMKKLGNYPAALRRAQLLKLIRVLDFNGVMNSLLIKHDDEKKEINDMGEAINDNEPYNNSFLDRNMGESNIITESEPINDPLKLEEQDLNNLRNNLRSKPTPQDSLMPSELEFLQFSGPISHASESNTQSTNNAREISSTSHLSNDSFNFNISVPSNGGGDIYTNSDLAGIEGLTYIDEEQKLWNEITNDAVWLNVPGGNPNQLPNSRHSKSAMNLNNHMQSPSNEGLGRGFFPNANNPGQNKPEGFNNDLLSAGFNNRNNDNHDLIPSNGYADIINQEFQDLMN